MRRSLSLCFVFLLAILFWSLGSTREEAKALTIVELTSPADSSKVITDTPEFKWTVTGPASETPGRFQIMLATDPNFATVIWDDTLIAGSDRSKVYDGAIPLIEWTAYYWKMKVQVDSLRTDGTDTTYWQDDFSTVSTFFYTTAITITVPGDLPTVQEGIVWATQGDTILVDPGTYYENLRFYKAGIVVTSKYLSGSEPDTSIINRTIIDGSELTRGEDKGSVVYFSSAVDSSSSLMGFTLRRGTGTKLDIGVEKRICGGGIVCDLGSSPTIAYNVITENQAEDDGGAIFINSAAPNILYNVILNNSTIEGSGGGIECRFSIQVPASSSPSVGAQPGELRDLTSTPEARLNATEEKLENSLNPRDATEVYPVSGLPPLAKVTQNTPPVAVIEWYARKDTLIQRDKYLPGDTLFFDGNDSYDPDGGDDYITHWQWRYFRHYRCYRDPSASPINLSSDSVAYLPVTEDSRLGMIRVYLEVQDTTGFAGRVFSQDTIEINVQYPPHADAGEDVSAGVGDTAWLDGSASCDINPGDVLGYTWTQVDALPPVTIENSNSAVAYFVAEDETYVGEYEFQLKVSDSMEADSTTVDAVVSRPPVPVCEDDPIFGDTLVGFGPSDILVLDACSSYDPDPGDNVVSYIWEEAGRWRLTKDGWTSVPFTISTNTSQCSQTISYPFGGLLRFYLKVRDSYGIESEDSCFVLLSIQEPPSAEAGNDSIVRTGTPAYLVGKAFETNPDQRESIVYEWFPDNETNPTPVTLIPSSTSDSVWFMPGIPGVYRFELQVFDGINFGQRDAITVTANTPPTAQVVDVDHAFEGREVLLDASASADPDSETFGSDLSFSWTALGPPPGAEPPVILDADQRMARFVPYGTGVFKFQVVVHDTLSEAQPFYRNVDTLMVTVDSTHAYPIIQGNLISYNYSGSRGGGIDCNQSSPDIFGNVFYRNTSRLSGGSICARNFSTPQIKDNIFFGNISSDSTGGGIADLKGELAPSATRGVRKYMTIENNDFWDNRGGAMYETSGNISGNIYDFPRLVDPEFGDYTLECSSPCEALDIGKLILFQPCTSVDRLGMLSLSMLQNPVATAVAHFVISTDATLKTEPIAYVTVGESAPSPVYFTPISPKSYRGSFVFTASGDAEISVFASSILEKDTVATETFSVQLIGAGGSGTLVSADRKVSVSFPEGSVDGGIYATCISVSKDARYQLADDPELEVCGAPYQLGPSISYDKDLTVSFPLDDVELQERDRTLFSVYRFEDGKWSQLESYLDGNSVCAEVKSLGVHRLIYDPTGKHITGRPTAFQLYQNYPNPFNPQTQIRYDLPVAGQVELVVYNVLGQRVRTLVDGFQDIGRKSVTWDGHDDSGGEAASGIYFYKLKADGFQKTMKMVLVK